MTPVVSLLPLGIAYYILRKKVSKEPLWLVLLLMALFMAGYVFLGFLGDEQKRNSTEALIQAALIGYVFLLTLFTRLRSIGTSGNKPFSKVREWFARRRKKEEQ
jgi:RsiW-degrading membrane proteinase PrsW (M82 family)